MAVALGLAATTIGVAMSYAGCVLLFQSGARRQRHKAIRLSEAQLRFAKVAAWVMVLGALVPFSIPQGIERGVAVWLAILALSGIASLIISAFAPRLHLGSVFVVTAIGSAFALTYSIAGTVV